MTTSRNAVFDVYVLAPAQKDLDKIQASAIKRIIGKIRALSREPRPFGCLKMTSDEGYRLRVGDYRVLYRIDDTMSRIFIYRVKHRKDACR
jgi:mRNA interferase RelE/StbE